MHSMIGRYIGWWAVSLIVFVTQFALGTSFDFAIASFSIFLLLPLAWHLYASVDNIGGYLLVTTFAKLFVFSQFIKIGMGQAADSYLDAPLDTALVLLGGMAGFLMAGGMLHQVLPLIPFRLMRPHHDPEFMRRTGLAALALSLVGSVWGWFSATPTYPWEEGSGSGNAVWAYLVMLLPFAAAIFTARTSILSNGTRSLDKYVIITLVVGIVLGIWGNSRTTLLSGLAAYYLTYLSYGGRIMGRHVGLAIAVTTLTQVLFFPLIDLQRQLPRDLDATEYVSATANIAANILRGEHMDTPEGAMLQNIYDLWSSRHYYGEATGFLDRFTPSQVDEAVYAIPGDKALGAENLLLPFLRIIPRRLAPVLGIDYPDSAMETIEYEIWRSPFYSSLNYGLFVEVHSAIGLTFLPVVTGIYLLFFFTVAQVIFGNVTRNYLATFCGSIFLFTIADGEMGELVARIMGQTVAYFTLYAIANSLWKVRQA